MDIKHVWMIIGFAGQFFFFSRFLVQWVATERQKKSVIPHLFWYFSILGGLVLLSYSIYRRDPVFILGQSVGLLVYFRNIYWVHKELKAKNLED